MRRIGTLTDASLAQRFCQYLVSLSIEATTASDGEQPAAWHIWIRDENDVPQAKAELAAFEAAPQSDRYQLAEEKIEQAASRDEHVCDAEPADPEPQPPHAPDPIDPSDQRAELRTRPGTPITFAIIIVSVIVSVTSNYAQPRQSRLPGQTSLEQRTFDLLAVADPQQYQQSGDPLVSIRRGQLWRLITPMFLHVSDAQLMFNMLWVFIFGMAIERRLGSLFMLLLALGTQLAGVLLQVSLASVGVLPESLLGSPLAIGASGAVYGLFGFLWVRPRVDRGYPNHLLPIHVALMLGWWVACVTPLIDNVANGAPIGGLIAGVLVALARGVKWQ